MIKMKNIFYLAAVLFGILLLVLPVSAETINGTLDYSIIQSDQYTIPLEATGYYPMGSYIRAQNIENTVGTFALIRFDVEQPTLYSSSSVGKSVPVNIRLTNAAGPVICSGTLGYQRNFNPKTGAEILGFQYITFNQPAYDLNILGLNGATVLYLDYDKTAFGTMQGWNARGTPIDVTRMGFAKTDIPGHYLRGNYILNKNYVFHNKYSVTKPSGLGITGEISKSIDGTVYSSKSTIYDSASLSSLAGQNLITQNDFSFNIPAESIIISVQNSANVLINSSILFTSPPVNMTVTPQSGKFTDTFTGKLNPITNIQAIRWYAIYPGQSSPSDFYDSTSTTSSQKHLNYALLNSNWMGWDTAGTGGFTNNKGGTIPNPVSLIPRYSGQILVGCYVYLTDGTVQNPTITITVGENQALQTVTFLGEDSLTGSLVSPSSFNIKKLSTNTWTNSSEVRPGQIDVQYPTGSALYVEVMPPTGSGYSPGTLTYQVLDTPGYTQQKVIQLWKGSSTNVSTTTANLIVNKNSDFSPIKGASIVLSDGQSCITSSAGSCQLTLNNGTTTYYATVKATGYQTNQFYFLPTGASYSKAFQMVAIGATQTPYITVPPVVTGTGIPAGITTLNPTSRNQAVSNAGDIWFNGAVGLSALIFFAVLWNVIGKINFGKKK